MKEKLDVRDAENRELKSRLQLYELNDRLSVKDAEIENLRMQQKEMEDTRKKVMHINPYYAL